MYILRWICCAAFAVVALFDMAAAQTTETPTTVNTNYSEAAKGIDATYEDLSLYVLPLNAQQLSELAEVWQDHLQGVIEENVASNLALQNADGEEAASIRTELVDITRRLIHTNDNYSLILNKWSSRGGTEEDLREHRAFDAALTAEVLFQSEQRTLLHLFWTWVTTYGGLIQHIWTAITVLAVLAGVVVSASLVRWLSARGLNRISTLSHSQRNLFGSLIFWATIAVGVVVVMGFVGFSITGVFALVGGVSLVLGLALQETIGNLASGLMLIFLKPIDDGDYIVAAGSEGTVQSVGLFSTKVRGFDNSLLIIPNGRLWSDTIRNVEANKVRRVELNFTVANTNDFSAVKTALNDLASAHPCCLPKPKPSVYVSHLDEKLMTIVFWVWVKTPDHWTTFTELSQLIQERFNATMMVEPVHKADIHISKEHEA